MAFKGFVLVAFVATAVLALLAAEQAAAVADNPCTWGPVDPSSSGNNSDLKITCPQDINTWVNWLVPKVIGPALCFIFMLLWVLCCPFFCCCRYCCCGGSDPRPSTFCGCQPEQGSDEAQVNSEAFNRYSKPAIWVVKGLVVVCLAMAIVALAVSFSGVGKAQEFPDALRDGVIGLVDWIIGIAMKLIDTVPMDEFDAFRSVKQQVIDMEKFVNDSVKKPIQDLADQSSQVTDPLIFLVIPTAIILLCAILAAVAAICRVRICLPVITITIILILGCIPIGALGLVSGILNIPVKVYCDEVDAWQAREAGFFKDFVKPQFCANHVNFDKLRDRLQSASKQVAQESCKMLADRCSSSTEWSTDDALKAKIFKCDSSLQCDTVSELADAVAKVTLKDHVPGTESCSTPCTVKKCADACTNDFNGYDIKTKSISYSIYHGSQAAAAAVRAILDILKGLSCDTILDRILAAFGTPICDTVHAGLSMLYAGAGLGVACNIVLVLCLWWGQKRFFSAKEAEYSGTAGAAFPFTSIQGGADPGVVDGMQQSMAPMATGVEGYASGTNYEAAKMLGVEEYPTAQGMFTQGLQK